MMRTTLLINKIWDTLLIRARQNHVNRLNSVEPEGPLTRNLLRQINHVTRVTHLWTLLDTNGWMQMVENGLVKTDMLDAILVLGCMHPS